MRRPLAWLVLLALLAIHIQPVLAQTTVPPEVTKLMASMTPEERVGQLFIVTFNGVDVGPGTPINNLIVKRHVGGVVLLAANDNFTAAPNTVLDALSLTKALQQTEWDGSQPSGDINGQTKGSTYIPLWIGISQEGNGAPTDQVFNGLTPLPSEMALGATWKTDLANQVGVVAGRELAAMGFNLFFGPSLDVLEQPASISGGDLGTRIFGGDPFWVGEMGRAYISGLHLGSNNRMAVVAKHFPGRGGSDRLPDQEVATVRKSLEQLKQIELPPFMSVTGNAPTTGATADGLLVSHIRYQGFQGNIRATTRPVSFDSQALGEILKLPQFAVWRANGGLMVSDDLGSRAVRDFYAPGGSAFNARLIVRDAFLAGNDLLYLGNIVSSDASDSFTTVQQILDYFAQKYREDTAFAQRVDAAVTRLLTRKFQLYGSFTLESTRPVPNLLEVGKGSDSVTFQVATDAATLISPDLTELATVLPSPPSNADYLVFITDSVITRQCSTCLDEPMLAVDALQQSILRLYGPSAGGQVIPSHLTSYAFRDLSNLLDKTGGEFLEPDLRRADWVILSLTDSSGNQPQLIRRFLSDRQDVLRGKKVILFSFGAPYYLDTTDISRLTAYYALYSKTAPFIDVAARLLYQELTPHGDSPVSIPAIGYDLISVTSPDPGQIISLFLDLPSAATPSAESTGAATPTVDPTITPEPTAVPLVGIGNTIIIRTSPIVDTNGNLVPDGTPVRFSVTLGGENGGLLKQEDATTVAGVARLSYRLEQAGLIEFRVSSDPANVSETLQLDVSQGSPMIVTVIVPVITETVEPTPTPLPPVQENDFVTLDGVPRFSGWILMLFTLAAGLWLAYWVGSRLASARWGVRWALCALLGGLLAYNYMALSLPGSADMLKSGGGGALVGILVLGEFLGAVIAGVWMRREAR